MHFPIIRDFKGKMGGMSQMAITVGLCNALSLCLEATIKKIETKEHWDANLPYAHYGSEPVSEDNHET